MRSPDGDEAAELFEELFARFLSEPEVTVGTGFGATPWLRMGRNIFAMVCRGELVMKLPRERVDELVAAGRGARFDARRDGRLMKEWVTVPVRQRRHWESLVGEALDFVSSGRRPARRAATSRE